MVKLIATSNNLIPRRYSSLFLDLVIINGEKEYKVEKILNSHWHCKDTVSDQVEEF